MKEGEILKIRAQRFLETAKDLYKIRILRFNGIIIRYIQEWVNILSFF